MQTAGSSKPRRREALPPAMEEEDPDLGGWGKFAFFDASERGAKELTVALPEGHPLKRPKVRASPSRRCFLVSHPRFVLALAPCRLAARPVFASRPSPSVPSLSPRPLPARALPARLAR